MRRSKRLIAPLLLALGLLGSAPQVQAADDPRETRALDMLFQRLGKTADASEGQGIAGAIQRIWMHSPSDTANLLMERAVLGMHAGDFGLAESLLDKVVAVSPDWAEAWNQRATIRYLRGNPRGSMADIAQVLKREPRHFGALMGMAAILETAGLKKSALAVYRKVRAIYPSEDGLQKKIDDLVPGVEGSPV